MTWARTVSAAAAVALLVAGCSGTGSATESAKPADDAHASATVADPAPVPDSASSEWVDVTGQGTTLPRDDEHRQYSPTPVPGSAIFTWPAGGGEAGSCTLGVAVREVGGDRTGFLTAAHCGEAPYEPTQFLASGPGPGDVVAEPLGELTEMSDITDTGIIWTPRAAATNTIAGFPIGGSMSEEVVTELPKGTPICLDGAVSGVVCSPLYGVVNNKISYGHTERGDSGAPVFVVNGAGVATLIGVHSGAYSASILAQTLQARGLELITAS